MRPHRNRGLALESAVPVIQPWLMLRRHGPVRHEGHRILTQLRAPVAHARIEEPGWKPRACQALHAVMLLGLGIGSISSCHRSAS